MIRTPAVSALTAALVLAGTLTGGLVAATAIAPAAEAASVTSFPTTGDRVFVRAHPTRASRAVGRLAYHQRIYVDCQRQGQRVAVGRTGSSTWWAHLPGRHGYVTTAFVAIPQAKLPGVPICGASVLPPVSTPPATPPPAPTPPRAGAFTFSTFGRDAYVRSTPSNSARALAHLADPDTIDVDCQVDAERVAAPVGSSTWWAHSPTRGGYVTVARVDIPEAKLPGVPVCADPTGGTGGTGGGTPQKGDVTRADLLAMFPGKVSSSSAVSTGLPGLNAAMRTAGITTAARKAAFLATLANESAFRYDAVQNSSTYTGRGYIQLTGSANYTSAGRYFGIDLVHRPSLAASLTYSASIARWYWTVARDINPLADRLDMGRVDSAIGYAWDTREDGERCTDFKAGLRHFLGYVPAGVNCVRPSYRSRVITRTESPASFADQMDRLVATAR